MQSQIVLNDLNIAAFSNQLLRNKQLIPHLNTFTCIICRYCYYYYYYIYECCS